MSWSFWSLLLLVLGCIGLVLVIFAYYVWPNVKGTAAAAALPDSVENFLNTLTNATVKATDVSSVVSSYIALTGIRKPDCVEADSKAVEAADYLRGVITAWKRPVATTETPVVVKPTVETLAAELAAVKAQLAAASPCPGPTSTGTGG